MLTPYPMRFYLDVSRCSRGEAANFLGISTIQKNQNMSVNRRLMSRLSRANLDGSVNAFSLDIRAARC